MSNYILNRSEHNIIDRLLEASQSLYILVDSQDLTDPHTVNKVFMMLIHRGVSARWLLFNRGLFWYRDNVINYN